MQLSYGSSLTPGHLEQSRWSLSLLPILMITHASEFVFRCQRGDRIKIDEATFVKVSQIRDKEVVLRIQNPLKFRFELEKTPPRRF